MNRSVCPLIESRNLKHTPCINPLTSPYGISSIGTGVSVGSGVSDGGGVGLISFVGGSGVSVGSGVALPVGVALGTINSVGVGVKVGTGVWTMGKLQAIPANANDTIGSILTIIVENRMNQFCPIQLARTKRGDLTPPLVTQY